MDECVWVDRGCVEGQFVMKANEGEDVVKTKSFGFSPGSV